MTRASLLGALTAPRLPPALLALPPARWQIATYLAEALRGTANARAVNAASRELAFALPAASFGTHARARSIAIALRDRVAALGDADRVPVLLAVLRALLDDAPTLEAVALDRAITAAARAEGRTPDAGQVTQAERIVAEVLP